ncbi:hypothetical protein [Piscinibacter terrae]|uniref:Uncharacterized protein n=1 Tax=Piscinibacter terrae TaxID=2496871 RepID=A0A3N7HPX0_9BURK|nr:hypothetical protein [Albitalea terrae]RQP23186.1 hypothetical protein DZC73_18920 [Albitalea terrae]
MSIPSLARLQADIGQTYQLRGPWQGELPVELTAADAGVAMNHRYCCYHAEFALPAGVSLPQVSCDVRAGDELWPMLLLTPGAPHPDDTRQRMHTVIHMLNPQATA